MASKRLQMFRYFKWVGVVACFFLIWAWVLSVTYPVRRIKGKAAIMLVSGGIHWSIYDSYEEMYFQTWLFGGSSSIFWLPRSTKDWSKGFSGQGSVFVPIWCILMAAAVPTYILWRRDKRYPPGHCRKCGYDLTGNESGVCPECGTPVSGGPSIA